MTLQTIDPTAYPYNSVVRVISTIGGNNYQASGVLISPDEVLTVDHIAYKSDADQVASKVTVALDHQPGTPDVTQDSGTVAHYTRETNVPNISLDTSQNDYAIIHLDKAVIGGSIMQVTPDFLGGSVHVSGYPVSGATQLVDDVQTVATDPNYSVYDGTTLGVGSSGGPVWTYGADGKADVVGLVSSESGSASFDTKITTPVADQIAAWVKADDTPTPQDPYGILASIAADLNKSFTQAHGQDVFAAWHNILQSQAGVVDRFLQHSHGGFSHDVQHALGGAAGAEAVQLDRHGLG